MSRGALVELKASAAQGAGMTDATLAQAMEKAQLIAARAALHREAKDVELTNRRIAKIAARSEQLVSSFFKGDTDSKRLEKIIVKEIARRRAKRQAKARQVSAASV